MHPALLPFTMTYTSQQIITDFVMVAILGIIDVKVIETQQC